MLTHAEASKCTTNDEYGKVFWKNHHPRCQKYTDTAKVEHDPPSKSIG